MKRIRTADEAIDAGGGTVAVAAYFGDDARVVSNWRERGLPANTYVAFTRLLQRRGYAASPALWGMRQPAATNGKKRHDRLDGSKPGGASHPATR